MQQAQFISWERKVIAAATAPFKPAAKHSPSKLEGICKRALLYSKTPNYKSIINLLTARKELPFEYRFGMLVNVEYTNRKNNRLKKSEPSGRTGAAGDKHCNNRLSVWSETE